MKSQLSIGPAGYGTHPDSLSSSVAVVTSSESRSRIPAGSASGRLGGTVVEWVTHLSQVRECAAGAEEADGSNASVGSERIEYCGRSSTVLLTDYRGGRMARCCGRRRS